mgnify:CR=1 FL=1
MGANATAEVEHIPTGELLLQSQGVGDVIRTAEVPGRQLKQVSGADRVFIEICRPVWVKGTRMHRSKILFALRKALCNLLSGQTQIGGQMLLHRKSAGQKLLDAYGS